MMNMLVINNKINFHTQKRSSWTIKWEQSSTHHCWPALRAFSSLLSSAASFTCLIVISRLSFWLIILPFHYHQGYQCYQWFSLYFPRWYHIPTYLSIWTPAPLVVEAETLNINGVHPAFDKNLTQAGLSNQAVPSLQNDKRQYCDNHRLLVFRWLLRKASRIIRARQDRVPAWL